MVVWMANEKTVAEILAVNLANLMAAYELDPTMLAEQSHVSRRHIVYVLKGEKTPSLEIVEKLARVFGLTVSSIMIDGLKVEAAKVHRVDKMMKNYFDASEETRIYIDHVASRDSDNKPR